MKQLNLWQSISLAFGSLATIIVIVIGAAYYFTTSLILQRSLQRILTQSATELIEGHLTYQQGEIRYKRAETGLTIAGFLRGTGVSAMVFDARLNRIGTYGLYRNLLDQNVLSNTINQEALQAVLQAGHSDFQKARYGKLLSPYEVLYVPIAQEDEIVGVLQMSISSSQLEQLQFLSGYLILTILPISLLLMWLIAFYLGKTWLWPLSRLVTLMKATQTHRLVDLPKLPSSPYPEIDQLQTALKQLLDRIRKNLESQRQFTAHAAHELKTPLAQAVSELDLIQPSLPLTGQITITTVKQDLLGLSRKIDSLMALTLLESKHTTFQPRKVRLAQAIQDALMTIDGQIKKQHLTVINKVATDHWWFIVPDHATLLLANLLNNAVKYNKRNGSIVIQSELKRGKQTLTIQDSGIGIAKKEQPQMFKRFFRSPETAQAIPGFGIGLTLVYSIARKSKIVIVIDSQPNKGTRVSLTQPLPHYLLNKEVSYG